jgi:hypothetical protein
MSLAKTLVHRSNTGSLALEPTQHVPSALPKPKSVPVPAFCSLLINAIVDCACQQGYSKDIIGSIISARKACEENKHSTDQHR